MTQFKGAQVAVHGPRWTQILRRRMHRPGSCGTSRMCSRVWTRGVFAGHKEYRGLVSAEVKWLCGCERPAVVDGRNVVDQDV